jgi:hypothetical protein
MSQAHRPQDQDAEPARVPGDRDVQWHQRRCDLLRIRQFDEDWDGAGASRPVPELVDAALQWLERAALDPQTSPPTAAAASPGGEIVFVWQDSGTFIEAEIVAANRIEWMRSEPGLPIQHWESDLEETVVLPVEHATT